MNNPMIMAMQIAQKNMNNPIIGNLMSMMNKNDNKGIETLARNICKERGIDADKMYNEFKSKIPM